jgi:hypothetical protein
MLIFCIKTDKENIVNITLSGKTIKIDDIKTNKYFTDASLDINAISAKDFTFSDGFTKTRTGPMPMTEVLYSNGIYFIVFDSVKDYEEFFINNLNVSIEKTFEHEEYLKSFTPAPIKIEGSTVFVLGDGTLSFTVSGLKTYTSTIQLFEEGKETSLIEMGRNKWDFEFEDGALEKEYFQSVTYNFPEDVLNRPGTKTLVAQSPAIKDSVERLYRPTKDIFLIVC